MSAEADDARPAARITAVIVNYRTSELTLQSLAALAAERDLGVALDAIVIDGGSGDGSADRLAEALTANPALGWVTLVPMAFNGGFGWGNNQAIQRALQRPSPPDYLYIVNPDAAVEAGAVAALAAALDDEPRAGAAGSRLLTAHGRPLASAFRFPGIASEFFRAANTPALERVLRARPAVIEADKTTAVDWVTGASVMMRAEALRQVGLFDEGFFLYYEEVELLHRMKAAGWSVLHVPASRVHHIGGAATGVVDGASAQRRLPAYWFRSRRRFFARALGPWRATLTGAAWVAGLGIWQVRKALGLGRASAHAPHECRDLLRHGFAPSSADRLAAVPRWNDATDRLPAWAER